LAYAPIPEGMTAKRAIWVVRAILYPSLALAAVLLFAHRGGEDAVAGTATVYGTTSQGFDFNASFRDGRMFRLHTHVRSNCPDAQTSYTWLAGGTRTRFETDGDEVHVRATTPWNNEWSVTHHLRLDARKHGDRLSGTMSAVVDVTVPFRGTCRSGPVTFSAHE
jgi:hypothetical protein